MDRRIPFSAAIQTAYQEDPRVWRWVQHKGGSYPLYSTTAGAPHPLLADVCDPAHPMGHFDTPWRDGNYLVATDQSIVVVQKLSAVVPSFHDWFPVTPKPVHKRVRRLAYQSVSAGQTQRVAVPKTYCPVPLCPVCCAAHPAYKPSLVDDSEWLRPAKGCKRCKGFGVVPRAASAVELTRGVQINAYYAAILSRHAAVLYVPRHVLGCMRWWLKGRPDVHGYIMPTLDPDDATRN